VKLRLAAAICAAACAMVAGADIAHAAQRPDFQRGFVLTSWDRDSYHSADSAIAQMAADGNDHVAVFTQWFVDSPTASGLAPDGGRTPSDASILHAIAVARSVGLQVVVKPQVGTRTGSWVGSLRPADPGAFWAGYRTMLLHYADLAQRAGASMLVVGTEMAGLSGADGHWRALIGEVRRHFAGKLTYAANYDEFDRVRFWDALDYIGIDAYFPLADARAPTPGPDVLAGAWKARGYLDRIAAVSARTGKPVLFTELGYRAVRDTAVHPSDWPARSPADALAQANAYSAFYRAVAGQPWMAGVYWWDTSTSPQDQDNGVIGRPAEAVMAAANGLTAPAPVLFADAAARLARR
jgi:hypothetical protein